MQFVKHSEQPSTFPTSRWETSGYRKQIVAAIEHAISYCPQPLAENAYDLEHRAFQESDNKKQYLHKVQKIIHSIDKKTFPNVPMERNKDSNISANTDLGNDAPIGGEVIWGAQCFRRRYLSTPSVCNSSSLHNDQKMMSRTYSMIKSKQLILKSRNYLKPRRNPLLIVNASGGISKKKFLLSRFKMHKYLSSLITRKQERIVHKINVETVGTDNAECRLQNVHEIANSWESQFCSLFIAGLEELDRTRCVDYKPTHSDKTHHSRQ